MVSAGWVQGVHPVTGGARRQSPVVRADGANGVDEQKDALGLVRKADSHGPVATSLGL